jgi:transcriptional regulator with PAS, ATPase and Fis domain
MPAAFETIIGEHPSMAALRDLVGRVARSKAGIVLIYGETGTGKGLVAREIHRLSARADSEFTAINCAAIPGNLLESELFGHERGAFTGAVDRKVGLLEIAHGGTVFLDEIRELDPIMQAKILTLLDSRRFRRIGSVREISTDVRFIAATNKILLGEVQAGKFRDDLYYRLQVVAINIPPLRDRGDDVFVLADGFLERYNRMHDSRFESIDPDVREIFRRYDWPGNVRELGNLLERICILESGSRIEAGHLPARIVRKAAGREPGLLSADSPPAGDYAELTTRYQRGLIEQALRESAGNLSQAAQRLGLSRHALRHQMQKLGL